MSLLRMYSKYKRAVRAALLLVGLLFVLILLKESWHEISSLIGQVKQGEFIFSVIVGVLGNVIIALLFNRLLGKHGVKISNLLALKMYMIGQIAKYIPGKIWGVAYQVSHVAGISGARGVMLANMEIMAGVMFMTSVVAVILLCFFVSKLLSFIFVLFGMAGFVFLYKTNIVNSVARVLSDRFKVIEFLADEECEPTSYSAGAAFYLIFCFLYVFSYVLMLDAVFGFSLQESMIYIALLSIAWIGGVLVFIVPLGIGVRELLFVVTSSYVIPEHSVEMLLAIAIISRFSQMIQEIAGVCLLVFLRR